jgi:hypothetical protein
LVWILGANHRKVGGIRYKVEINTEAIGRLRGALWQGKEDGSADDQGHLHHWCGEQWGKSLPQSVVHSFF